MHTQKYKLRLGLFVIGGLTLFVLAVFIIGKQKNLFDPVFKLTATFSNVSGLQVGNNIRFSGINVGTVGSIDIISDTTVRVDMLPTCHNLFSFKKPSLRRSCLQMDWFGRYTPSLPAVSFNFQRKNLKTCELCNLFP